MYNIRTLVYIIQVYIIRSLYFGIVNVIHVKTLASFTVTQQMFRFTILNSRSIVKKKLFR